MDTLVEFGTFIYVYCTDFVINLANLSGLSYYEINALIFCVLWPLLTLILILLNIIQSVRLYRKKG